MSYELKVQISFMKFDLDAFFGKFLDQFSAFFCQFFRDFDDHLYVFIPPPLSLEMGDAKAL